MFPFHFDRPNCKRKKQTKVTLNKRTETRSKVTEQQIDWLTETDAKAEGWAVIAQPQIMLMLSFNEWISSVLVPGLLPPYVEHTLCFRNQDCELPYQERERYQFCFYLSWTAGFIMRPDLRHDNAWETPTPYDLSGQFTIGVILVPCLVCFHQSQETNRVFFKILKMWNSDYTWSK